MSTGKSVHDLQEELNEELDRTHRELAKLRSRISDLEDQVETGNTNGDASGDLVERVEKLEEEVQRATATNDEQKASKLEKFEAVVRHAHSKDSGGIAGVQIEYGEVVAATDCSRQWAHTLMDEMAAKFEFASKKSPAGKKKQLRIRTGEHSLEEMINEIYGDEE